MPIRARAPGKVVALGEYAVLEGAPALVLAVDRYAAAHDRAERRRREPSDDRCSPTPTERAFAPGEPSGSALVDLVTAGARGSRPVARHARFLRVLRRRDQARHRLERGGALCAWAGAWAAHARRAGLPFAEPTLEALIALHRRFQGGKGSGIDVAASFRGGAVEFASGAGRYAPNWFSPAAEQCRIREYFCRAVGVHARVRCALSGLDAGSSQRRRRRYTAGSARLRRPVARPRGGTQRARSSKRSRITAAVCRTLGLLSVQISSRPSTARSASMLGGTAWPTR